MSTKRGAGALPPAGGHSADGRGGAGAGAGGGGTAAAAPCTPVVKKMKIEPQDRLPAAKAGAPAAPAASPRPAALAFSQMPVVSQHAHKLNEPMLARQNQNLATELFSAKRRIAELEAAQRDVLRERDHAVNCLGLMHRSWNELDADLRVVVGGGGGAAAAPPLAGDDVSQFMKLFAPAVRFSRIVPLARNEDSDSDDDDEEEEGEEQQQEEQHKPDGSGKAPAAGAAAARSGDGGRKTAAATDTAAAAAQVTEHLQSRLVISKGLARALAAELGSGGATTGPARAAVVKAAAALTEARLVAARAEKLAEKLAAQRKLNAELEEQLTFCKFQRERAKSKWQLALARTSSGGGGGPGGGGGFNTTPALVRASSGGSTPGWIRHDVARFALEGTATPGPDASLGAASSLSRATPGSSSSSSSSSSTSSSASAAAAAQGVGEGGGAAGVPGGAGAGGAAAAEGDGAAVAAAVAAAAAAAAADVERLEEEVKRINADFDAQVAGHAARARELSTELARRTAAAAASAAQVAHLRQVIARDNVRVREQQMLSAGADGAAGGGPASTAAQELDRLRRALEEERQRRRKQAAHDAEKLAVQAELYRKAVHDLGESKKVLFSTKERYQRKVHQLETERHALRQTLKVKDSQNAGIAAQAKAARAAQMQLDSVKAQMERNRIVFAGRLEQASEEQAKRIHELEAKLAATGGGSGAGEGVGLAAKLAETQEQLRVARAQFHKASATDQLFREIEVLTKTLNEVREQTAKLRRLLDEKAAECLKYSSAKTKADRLNLHHKSLEQAAKSEMKAASTLQQQLSSKARNLEQQLALLRPLRSENDDLVRRLQATQDDVKDKAAALSRQRDEFEVDARGRAAECEALRVAVAAGAAEREALAKAAEKYRRQYNEQKEKLGAFRRARRKLAGDEAEKQQLYHMLECQVCASEFKNVLLPCLHMFCRGCIDKQIKSRNRKCPACNLRFDADSVKDIVFNS